jgi:hypothetical protein
MPLNAALLALPATFLICACTVSTSGHSGEELVAKYCTSCHLAPVPEQLPKESWPFVLKWMGNYLGFRDTSGALDGIVNIDIIPDKKIISSGDFSKIESYYLSKSKPQKEMFVSDRREYEPTTLFNAEYSIKDVAKGEFVSMVQFDPYSGYTFVGYGTENNNRLEMYNKRFEKMADFKMKSEPVHLAPLDPGFRLSLIGDFSVDKGEGEVFEVRPGKFGRLDVRHLITGYNRLTQSLAEDFNQDGRQDLLLVGFGQGHIGRTSVVHQMANGEYGDEIILLNAAGSLCAEVRDFDGNGYPDIMLLVAQEYQELLLFLNQGKGQFQKKLLHKEFAGFGYNHFTLADFNGDGKIDVVTSNGNNMEIVETPLKAHHGVRILLNQGDLTWKEEYFFPMHGAIKSIAHDFDQDGDVDIASIAFYPDWDKEFPATFIYLRNDGALSQSGKFTASTLPDENWGRWMVMDSADINGDGYRDLILGAAYIGNGIAPRYEDRYKALAQQSQPLLFLYNNSGRDKKQ